MGQVEDEVWTRRGFTLLWSATALGAFCSDTSEIISLRALFQIKQRWPESLPSSSGGALVVTGLEGCMDRISPEDAATWLEEKLRPVMLGFQREYEDAALIFWFPTGERRVDQKTLDDSFTWKYGPPFQKEAQFPLSFAVFGGAYKDAGKILHAESDARGHKAPAWAGIYLSRMA
jgi:hypothetical protein